MGNGLQDDVRDWFRVFFFFNQGWFILEVKGGDGTQGENWIGVSKAAPPKVKTPKD